MAEESHRTPREETTLERADRNFGELLQELWIIQTGVQILFAFLLTLAFTARFPTHDTAQRAMYITALLLAVLAAALFTERPRCTARCSSGGPSRKSCGSLHGWRGRA